MSTLGPLDIEFLINNADVDRQANRVKSALRGVNQDAQQQAQQSVSSIETLAKRASIAAASYFSLQAAGNFVKSMVEVRGEFQQIEVAYRTMLGSKEKADQLMAESVNLAAKTPFTLQEVATGSKQLLAYGTQFKDVTKTVEMLGNVASGVSAPLGDIIYLYGTLQTQGRAYQRDIIQFTGRGIPIVAELAKQFGTTEAEVAKLVEAGKVGFPEIEKAFQSLTGSSGIFYNLMREQSKTLTGQLSNLSDAWSRMLNDLGKSNQGILSEAINDAISLVNNYEEVIQIIEGLVVVYGVYKGVLLATTVVQRLSEEIALQQALAGTELTLAQGLQAVSLRALSSIQLLYNSAALQGLAVTAGITIAIAGLAFTVKALVDEYNHVHLAESQLNDIRGEAIKNLQDQKLSVDELVRVATNENSKLDEKQAAIKKLNEISPEYLGALNAQNIATKEGTDAIKAYLAALNDKLIGESAYAQKLENLKKAEDLKTRGYAAMGISEEAGAVMQDFFTGGIFRKGNNKQRVIDNYVKDLLNANDAIDKKFAEQLKNRVTGGNTKEDTDAQKRAKQIVEQLKDPLKNFDVLIAGADSKSQLDAIQKSLQEKLDALAPNDKQQAILKERLKAVQKLLKTYSLTEDKADNSAFEAAQRHAEMINKIYQLNEKYTAQTLDDNNQKLQAIRDEYAKLSTDIDKYNADPKNTQKVGKQALQKGQQKAINNQVDENVTADIATTLEERKQAFAEYEAYRAKLGDEAAAKEYAGLLESGSSFKQYLLTLESLTDDSNLSPQAAQNRQKLFKQYKDDVKRDDAAANLELLANTLTFEQQRTLIVEKSLKEISQLRAQGYDEQAAQATQMAEAELTRLDQEKISALASYKELYDGLQNISTTAARKDIAALSDFIEKGFKAGTITKEAYLSVKKMLAETSAALDDKDAEKLIKLASSLEAVASAIGTLNGEAGAIAGTLAQVINSIGQVEKLSAAIKNAKNSEDKFTAQAGLVTTGINGITSLISMFTSAAKERKQAEEAYYASILKSQNDYNLSLNDEIRLRTKLNQNVFTKDYKKEILDASLALDDANKKYSKALADLDGGRAKVGQKNAVDGKNALGGLAAGASAGAAIGALAGGDVLSVPAAAAGAVIGGVVGLISGLFGGKKKVDVYDTLLGQYPDLIQKAADGTKKLNVALAQNLIQNNLVDDATKGLLQNTIALNDAREKAIAQINDTISTLAGSLGDDLRNSLVSAFKDGTDAAKAFGDSVSKVIENIISQFLFNEIFSSSFDSLQANLKESLGIGGDQNTTDDLVKFYKEASPLIAKFNDGLKAAKDEGKKAGLDVFGSSSSSGTSASSSLSGAIKGITESQANVLEGALRGMQLSVSDSNISLKSQLVELRLQTLYQKDIVANTKRTADNTDSLPAMATSLKSIDKNTYDTTSSVLRAAGLTRI